MTCSHEQTHGPGQSTDPQLRILIVEDEPIVALNYATILQGAGFQIVGPVGTITKAIDAIERQALNGAVLDIDIGGVPVDPVIVALRRRNLPYIFVSAFAGYDDLYGDGRFLSKPCIATDLIRSVSQMARKNTSA